MEQVIQHDTNIYEGDARKRTSILPDIGLDFGI